MQLSSHLLQLPEITATTSPSMKFNKQPLSVKNQTPRQLILKKSKSNDHIPLINENSEGSNTTPKIKQLRRKQSSGERSHVFVMSLNKTTQQSREEFSTSNKVDAKIRKDQNHSPRKNTLYIRSAEKKRSLQNNYKQHSFGTIQSGNLSSSRNKMENLNSHPSETFENKSNEISMCKSPVNNSRTDDMKSYLTKQKTSVKKIIGKIGIQQNS